MRLLDTLGDSQVFAIGCHNDLLIQSLLLNIDVLGLSSYPEGLTTGLVLMFITPS